MEMINNVVSFPPVPDATQVKPAPDVPKEVAGASSAGQAKPHSDGANLSGGQEQSEPPYYALRLTVDKDPKTGEWIYKAIDRDTGKVVRQLPRQELLDLRKSSSYQPGSVIKTDI